jgi:hypothetical protein
VNFPCKSTNGTGVPLSSKPIMAEFLVLLLSLLLHHLHQSYAVCTIVPSSIVTKSPEITLKAFSGFDKVCEWQQLLVTNSN